MLVYAAWASGDAFLFLPAAMFFIASADGGARKRRRWKRAETELERESLGRRDATRVPVTRASV